MIVGVPAALLMYRKLAVLDPLGIETDVMNAVFAALTNAPVADVDDNVTVCVPEVIGAPAAV